MSEGVWKDQAIHLMTLLDVEKRKSAQLVTALEALIIHSIPRKRNSVALNNAYEAIKAYNGEPNGK